jgi:hypothetical protein
VSRTYITRTDRTQDLRWEKVDQQGEKGSEELQRKRINF